LETERYTSPNPAPADSIDFGKLNMIVRANWIWIALILVTTNAIAFLYIRYTKQLYESVSEIKLDIKQDATDLGFRELVPDRQNINVISSEIETIKSKLFLASVIDSLNLDVSYYSVGQFLNTELHRFSPFTVTYELRNTAYHNIFFQLDPVSETEFELQVSVAPSPIRGTYDVPVQLDGLTLQISRNKNREFIPTNTYSFVINSQEVVLANILQNLTVEPLNFNANTMRVSFKDSNPDKAQDLVNGIDSLYLQYSNEQKNLANRQKIEWLSKELSQIEKKMEGFEDYFENFTLENKTSNLDEDLRKTINQINRIDSQRFEVTRRIELLNELMDNLSRQSAYALSRQQTILPEFMSAHIEKLQELYLEMDNMKLSYSETTFAYRQKQNEIGTLEKKVKSELQELKAGWLQKLQDLNRAKAALERNFAQMPDKGTQYNKNFRFYKLYEEFYLTLIQSKSEFEIAQAGSTPDFKILATATLPSAPIAPKKLMIYGIGLVAGLVLNVFFVGVLYLANNTVTSIHEIERATHLPVLGIVPASRNTDQSGIYILNHPKSMVSEAIRLLRTNLDFFHVNGHRKTIAISSTISGEGKSFIARNLGGVIALSKKKVVLLDLDMRKAKQVPQADNSKGMSTLLIRKHALDECIVKTEVEGFDVIPSGPQPPNPSELLVNGEFTELLEVLKSRYDFIIMDTPPVGLVTDGIMAMRHADVSIYVFRVNYSKKSFIHTLQRLVRLNKLNNLTTVLNALPASPETAYGYGYYQDRKINRLTSLLNRGA
jgi:capsular exopolysaccharide synthesis family protein